jgi:hypothetical protein
MERQSLNSHKVLPFNLNPVYAGIFLVEIIGVFRILRDNEPLGNKKTSIKFIYPEEGEDIEKVDVLFNFILFDRCIFLRYPYRPYRIIVPQLVQCKKLFLDRCVLWSVQHEGVSLPRSLYIQCNAVFVTLDLFNKNSRSAIQVGRRPAYGAQVRFRHDRILNPYELVFLFQ